MAAQSDPDRNPNFRRRWSAPPLKQTRPRIAGTIQGAREDFDNSSNNDHNDAARFFQWASRLDRVADYELAHGHADAAERLSQQAAELREVAR